MTDPTWIIDKEGSGVPTGAFHQGVRAVGMENKPTLTDS